MSNETAQWHLVEWHKADGHLVEWHLTKWHSAVTGSLMTLRRIALSIIQLSRMTDIRMGLCRMTMRKTIINVQAYIIIRSMAVYHQQKVEWFFRTVLRWKIRWPWCQFALDRKSWLLTFLCLCSLSTSFWKWLWCLLCAQKWSLFRCQFHQHFMSSFCAKILLPINYKPK